ncbi:MAG: NADH-quinone oxidoreductase subunit L [Candidatus Neomarinimicrobiota bacterium]
MADTLYLITLFPLLGFLVNGLFGRWLSERQSGMVASGMVLGSFIVSAQLLLSLLGRQGGSAPFVQTLFSWIQVGDLHIQVRYLFDPLTAVMTLVITGVGLLIHIYSIGYMHGDPGIKRYFAFLNLFTFMMLNLVLADNLVLLFLGWEGVGLCSYLLIGFWFQDEAKARAGMKAFIVNRIGDAGFLIALIILYNQFGTLSISAIAEAAPGAQIGRSFFIVATLLLFMGATGKSAQVPLYVWLPDAMAGPTPVSALIHAATMVTAGVYLVARNSVLFSMAPFTMGLITVIGTFTAFIAATIALTQNDIKKVLAYSTISQLGFMFMAVGVGAFAAGIFHLMTHAFFKGLLFLGAGSVIHSLGGEQDMRKMGGLKKAMPGTHLTMLVGVLAISGIPGLSGFFSKDEILREAFTHYAGFSWIWLVGIITAGLTSFYMFRLLFRTFYSKPAWKGKHEPHESPSVMTIPLILLAFMSVLGGYVGIPAALGGANAFHHFLEPVLAVFATPGSTVADSNHMMEILLMIASSVVALGGAYYAYQVYVAQPDMADDIAQKLQLLHRLSLNKYYVDEAYQLVVVRPFQGFSRALWRWFDEKLVDRLVNGSGEALIQLGGLVRQVQNGVIQHYAAFVLAGVLFIMAYIYLN